MRTLIIVLTCALAVLQLRLWVAEGGFREVWRLEDQVEQRTNENRMLAERNAALAAEVQDLKSGLAAAEERARSELGLVQPDESFYQIVPLESVALSGAHSGGGEGAEPPPAPSAPSEQDIEGAAAAVSSIR